MMFHVSNRIKGRAIERIGAGMGEMRELEKELNWKKGEKEGGPCKRMGCHSVFVVEGNVHKSRTGCA